MINTDQTNSNPLGLVPGITRKYVIPKSMYAIQNNM